MDFFDTLAKETRVYEPVRVAPTKDPLTVMRNKFIANAIASADALDAGKEEGKFFFIDKSGDAIVSFRNGMKIIAVPPSGATHFSVSKQKAVKLLRGAADAAEHGEFDDLLLKTRMKRRKKNV